MRIRRNIALALAVTLAPALLSGASEEPRDSGLVERTGRRLVQIDVTITGPSDAVTSLDAPDFELVVGGQPIESFTLDRICDETEGKPHEAVEADEPAAAPPAEPPATAAAPIGRATYLFYFDQSHLTGMGRQNAIDMAHELIDELVSGGDQAMIVSSGQELRTFSSLTTDVQALHAAVDTVEGDRKQWDPWVMSEDSRIAEVIDKINDGMLEEARARAAQHQAEERWRAEKELRRFSMILAHLGDLDPPKVVVYFADTMRRNPGEHYLGAFSRLDRRSDPFLRASALDAFASSGSFERVIDEASAHGVRIYAVEAQGLTTASPTTTGVMSRPYGGQELNSTRHVSDAQDSLVTLARETGGQAFLNGVRANKIAKRIEDDLACVYVISFDGEGLPEDSPLAVRLRVNRPKVAAETRGRLVVQSESAGLTSRLLAAFAAPDAIDASVQSRSVLVPTGFVEGRYRALVQLVVPGSPLAGSTWDL
jgi:VWFA-related protein